MPSAIDLMFAQKHCLFSPLLLLKIFCLFLLPPPSSVENTSLDFGVIHVMSALANKQSWSMHLLESAWHDWACSLAPTPSPGEEPPGITAASSSAWCQEWVFADGSRAQKKQGAQPSQTDVLEQWPPTFSAPGTGFMEDNFSMDPGERGWGGDGSGSNVSDGKWWGAADEASLTRPPLTSCCVARFLTGCRPVLVCNPGVEDPCLRITFPVVLIPWQPTN